MLGEPLDDELGPPVLLKRFGNALEAHLARQRLESAGIPSFVAAPDAFAGQAAGTRVPLFVPPSCVAAALDVLDQPPPGEQVPSADDLRLAAWLDDPGRPLAFRAFVASVAGWTVVFMTVVGLLLAVPTFTYAILLAVAALRRSTLRDRGLRLQVAGSLALSALGLAMAATLGLYLASPR